MQTSSMRRTHAVSAPSNHGLPADLASRFAQDVQRDPVDAFHDAQTLYLILHDIHQLVNDPTTRYVLTARIREDLARCDLAAALAEAQQLLQFNERRCNAFASAIRDRPDDC
ncbi:hypothetical protein H0A66_00500 [Alcaligenaceae bacterium]|nr:hypothetical protein [Alcaligenaceae bacterium]